jgi:hypothetical protein
MDFDSAPQNLANRIRTLGKVLSIMGLGTLFIVEVYSLLSHVITLPTVPTYLPTALYGAAVVYMLITFIIRFILFRDVFTWENPTLQRKWQIIYLGFCMTMVVVAVAIHRNNKVKAEALYDAYKAKQRQHQMK